jgi:hypothetical protein
MKRYGIQNDTDDGDTVANCINARKSSTQRADGKGPLRSSKRKHQLRTMMNKRARTKLKVELDKEIE